MTTLHICDRCSSQEDVNHFYFTSSVAAEAKPLPILPSFKANKPDNYYKTRDLCIRCRTELVELFEKFIGEKHDPR